MELHDRKRETYATSLNTSFGGPENLSTDTKNSQPSPATTCHDSYILYDPPPSPKKENRKTTLLKVKGLVLWQKFQTLWQFTIVTSEIISMQKVLWSYALCHPLIMSKTWSNYNKYMNVSYSEEIYIHLHVQKKKSLTWLSLNITSCMDARVHILETHSEAGRFQTDKLRPLPQAWGRRLDQMASRHKPHNHNSELFPTLEKNNK